MINWWVLPIANVITVIVYDCMNWITRRGRGIAPPVYVGTLHKHEKSEVVTSLHVSKEEQAKLKTLLSNFEPLIFHIDDSLYYVIQPTHAGGKK